MATTDRPFIAASWAQSWPRPAEVSLVPTAAWRAAAYAAAQAALEAPDVRVYVLADLDSQAGASDVFGYLALRPVAGEPLPIVLFVYVKRAFRRYGFARSLARAAGLDLSLPLPCVCWTSDAAELRDAGVTPHAHWRPDLGRLLKDTHGPQAREEAAPAHAERPVDPARSVGAPAGRVVDIQVRLSARPAR